jgi:hypothetical protein
MLDNLQRQVESSDRIVRRANDLHSSFAVLDQRHTQELASHVDEQHVLLCIVGSVRCKQRRIAAYTKVHCCCSGVVDDCNGLHRHCTHSHSHSRVDTGRCCTAVGAYLESSNQCCINHCCSLVGTECQWNREHTVGWNKASIRLPVQLSIRTPTHHTMAMTM